MFHHRLAAANKEGQASAGAGWGATQSRRKLKMFIAMQTTVPAIVFYCTVVAPTTDLGKVRPEGNIQPASHSCPARGQF